MKIFTNTGVMEQSAHFGWQNKDEALYGIREGYKNSADELVEISLKHIYLRAYGKIPSGGHSLLDLWDKVKREVIDDMINSEEFLEQVKEYKNNFMKYSLEGISINKIRLLMKELQEVN